MLDLRLGDWHDVLADVECDALVVDPPYGVRTHTGHNAIAARHDMPNTCGPSGTPSRRRGLLYSHWVPSDVEDFVASWSPRVRGWFCAMSCSDLFPAWREALEHAGRVTFAPVPCVINAMSVRLAGDGPSNWAVYLNVARPRGLVDGTRRGAYVVNRAHASHIGGKPRSLMLQIVQDYSREGDLVCDPCAGYGTTLRAALLLGRRAVGAEIDPDTYATAMGRRPAADNTSQISLPL